MKKGIIAALLGDGDKLVGATITDGNNDIMLFSNSGKAIRFDESQVRSMGRGSRGVKGMNLASGQKVISMLAAPRSKNKEEGNYERNAVFLATENGYGKRTRISEFSRHSRGVKGVIGIQTSERNGQAVGACLVSEKDEIMLITNNGVIVRTRVSEVREMGRSTQGVRLISLDKDQSLITLQRIEEEPVD